MRRASCPGLSLTLVSDHSVFFDLSEHLIEVEPDQKVLA
jgi:hypothetical protein